MCISGSPLACDCILKLTRFRCLPYTRFSNSFRPRVVSSTFARPSKMASTLVDWSQKTLWLSIASIAFNPTAWNIVAQNGTYIIY